jgi:magnesium-transporting ATPase (P-type)
VSTRQIPQTGRLHGVSHPEDIVKGGIRERFPELRQMGIRTGKITGDNPLTAIAAASGVRRLSRLRPSGRRPASPDRPVKDDERDRSEVDRNTSTGS